MANKVESEPCGGGRRITRLVSTDRDIVVPDSIDGAAVVAIGPFFLSGSPASDGRTVTVPGTVAEIDRDAFGGIIGIREIAYGGTMEDFCSLGLDAEFDVEVSTSRRAQVRFPLRVPHEVPGVRRGHPGHELQDDPGAGRQQAQGPGPPDAGVRGALPPLPVQQDNAPRGAGSDLGRHIETGRAPVHGNVRRCVGQGPDGEVPALRSGKTAVTSMLMSELYSRRNGEKGA